MSWWSGSHEVNTSPASSPPHSMIAVRFRSRLSGETLTPLGRPLDPDVNCSNAVSGTGARGMSATSGRVAQSSRTVSPAQADPAAASPTVSASALSVSTRAGRATSKIPATCFTYTSRPRKVSGAATGDGTAPASIVPTNATMNSRESPSISDTGSPWTAPLPRSSAATRRTSAASSA